MNKEMSLRKKLLYRFQNFKNLLQKKQHDKYFNKNQSYIYDEYEDLSIIPKEDITQEIVDTYFNKYKNLSDIPEKFITQEMVNERWNKTKSLENIPENYITEDMCVDHLIFNNGIRFIPTKFMNNKMIIFFIKNSHILDCNREINEFKKKNYE